MQPKTEVGKLEDLNILARSFKQIYLCYHLAFSYCVADVIAIALEIQSTKDTHTHRGPTQAREVTLINMKYVKKKHFYCTV